MCGCDCYESQQQIWGSASRSVRSRVTHSLVAQAISACACAHHPMMVMAMAMVMVMAPQPVVLIAGAPARELARAPAGVPVLVPSAEQQ